MLTVTLTLQDGTESVLELGDQARVTVQGVRYSDEAGHQQPVELGYNGGELKALRIDGYEPPMPPMPPPPMKRIEFRLNDQFEPSLLEVPDPDNPEWMAARQKYLREQAKRSKAAV